MAKVATFVRTAFRGARLGGTLAALTVSAKLGRHGTTHATRAAWLQRASQRILRILGVTIDSHAPEPPRGLVVSNHLGYLDVLVLASLWPTAFVAKSEVADWPVFGPLTRAAGTIFIRRRVAADLAKVGPAVGSVLAVGLPVVLFPEGTSTDGTGVLPFRPGLFSAAIDTRQPVTPVWLGYSATGADPSTAIAYWGDMTLVPHLVGLLGIERIVARVRVAPVLPAATCRKELALAAHAAILRLSEPRV